MKINSSAGFEYYQNYVQNQKAADAKPAPDGQVPVSNTANTDKVTFSDNAAARGEVSRLASSVATQVQQTPGGERVAELRTAVQNGSYSVPAGEVANAILGLDRKV